MSRQGSTETRARPKQQPAERDRATPDVVLRSGTGRPRPALIAVLTAAAGLTAVSVAGALSNDTLSQRGAIAALNALIIGVTVGVGIYAWTRERSDRFGKLLIASGLLWGLTTLTAAPDETLHSIGRVAHWAAELTLLYTILSYPSGVLQTRAERRLFAAAVVLVAVLFLPTALLVAHYDNPFPWQACAGGCPPNAFMLVGDEPGFIADLVNPLREWLGGAVYLAAIMILANRIKRATPPVRGTLVPVLGAAVVRTALALAFILGRHWLPVEATDPLGWLAALGIPVMALGFLVGLLNWRMLELNALEQLTPRLSEDLEPDDLRSALSEALQDPELEVFLRDPDSPETWYDLSGRRSTSVPRAGPGRELIAVPADRPIAVIVHDAALRAPRQFLDSIADWALAALERESLRVALDGSLHEARRSRSRIAAAADQERQRVERDLHDSVQQELVMLRVQLQLVTKLVERDPAGGVERLRALGPQVDHILEEIRSIARGLYPPLLSDAGVEEALRRVATRSSLPMAISAEGIRRYAPEVESAVYFSCLEALQNASKHAEEATFVSVSLVERDGALRFEVRDDGCGFSPGGNGDGSGLVNIRDRLAAIGGWLEIDTGPGRGTRVVGTVPMRGA